MVIKNILSELWQLLDYVWVHTEVKIAIHMLQHTFLVAHGS